MKFPKIADVNITKNIKKSENKTFIFFIAVVLILTIVSFVSAWEEVNSALPFFDRLAYIWKHGWIYMKQYAIYALIVLVVFILFTYKPKHKNHD
jgi:membrane-bound metal-dependent hydrolase YbcI (DUF457 family)